MQNLPNVFKDSQSGMKTEYFVKGQMVLNEEQLNDPTVYTFTMKQLFEQLSVKKIDEIKLEQLQPQA